MVTVEQIQRGFALFVDNEIAVAFDKWQKVVIGGFGALLASNLPHIVKQYSAHPLFSAIGVYDPTNNAIDLDALYNAFVPKLGTEKIPITIPKIATIKLGREELDALVRYIKES